MFGMNIEKVNWDCNSDPECSNGDIVVLVQYGEAEIGKYVTPKPKDAPVEGGNFLLEMCSNEDDLEEEILKIISRQYPQVEKETNKPLLFLCPEKFSKRAIWD